MRIDRSPLEVEVLMLRGIPYLMKPSRHAREADAILLAAIGSPQYDGAAIRPEQGLLALRKNSISMPIFGL